MVAADVARRALAPNGPVGAASRAKRVVSRRCTGICGVSATSVGNSMGVLFFRGSWSTLSSDGHIRERRFWRY